jgi:hypothetical protein
MRHTHLTFAAAALWFAVNAHGQVTDEFATGNMHFDAKAMDANGDGTITREEAMAYAHRMWQMMSAGKPDIPVQVAAKDFARGNMRLDAQQMDTDHDGMISASEFMDYVGHRFDHMKGRDGNMTVQAAAKAFSRGNAHVASGSTGETQK